MGRKNERALRGTKNRKLHNKIDELETLVFNNTKAMEEGGQKKNWSPHDLVTITPLTPVQEEMFIHFYQGDHICAHGSAGTGKTFLAMYLALSEIFKKDSKQNKVIIIRSAVSTRDIGFMPGDYDEKIALYEMPYIDICDELTQKYNSYQDLKAAGRIKFMSTSFIRGVTWDNAIVIVDEGQNMTFHEINSIMTRMGVNSKMLFLGDMPQTDLRKFKNDTTGMGNFLQIIKKMSSFADIHFTHHDIVRSDFVKSWIIASEEFTD